MNRRDATLWALAIGGSLLLHLALFVRAGSHFGVDAPPARPQASVTHLSFRSVSAPPTVAPQTPKPHVVPKPPPKKTPPPKPRPKPKSKPRPKPVAKPRPAPKPAPKPEPEPTSAPAPSRASAPSANRAPVHQGPVAGSAPKPDPQLLERARQAYLSRLMAHIEAHKHYPRAARRRGIEGRVHVSFRLLDGGRVEQLRTQGARHLLRQAAAQAVRDALPLPPPPPAVTLPLPVAFEMVFALR